MYPNNDSKAETIIGEINIIPTRKGSLTLLEGVTIVEEIQPKERLTEPTFDHTEKEVVQYKETTLGGTVISRERVEVTFSPEISKVLLNYISYIPEFSDIHLENKRISEKINRLSQISGGLLDSFDYSKFLLEKLNEIQAIGRTEILCDLDILTLEMSDFIRDEDIISIETQNPNEIFGCQVSYDISGVVRISFETVTPSELAKFPSVWHDGRKVEYRYQYSTYSSLESLLEKLQMGLDYELDKLNNYGAKQFEAADLSTYEFEAQKEFGEGLIYQGVTVYSSYNRTLQTKWFKTEIEAKESIVAAETFVAEWKEEDKADALARYNRSLEDDYSYDVEGLDMSIEIVTHNGYTYFVGYIVEANGLEVMYVKKAAFTKEEIEAARSTEGIEKFKRLLTEISSFKYSEEFEDVERFAQDNRKGRLMSEMQSYLDRACNEAYEMSEYAYELLKKQKKFIFLLRLNIPLIK